MSRTRRIVGKTAARGERGMAVAHSIEVAEEGARVLSRGGNAFDAAVAMSFVAAVREPAMNGIGGVGVLLAHSARTRTTTEINFYGRTPAELSENAFEPYLRRSVASENARRHQAGFGWDVEIEGLRNERGALSVGIPTLVSGLFELQQMGATMPWRELLTSARELAFAGFAADEMDTFHIASHRNLLAGHGEIGRVLMPGGDIPAPPGFYQGADASVVRQQDLGGTIARLAEDGPAAMYRGEIGRTIADHVRGLGGVLSAEDFGRYELKTGTGLRTTYKGCEIVTSAGATGGLTLVEMLNLAEQFELSDRDRWSGEFLHHLAEIMRQAWTDRFVYVGDLDGANDPGDGLTNKKYAHETARGLVRHDVPTSTRPGDPWPYSSATRPSRTWYARDPGGRDTTHLAVVDGEGNTVTLTQTLGTGFGSCVMVPGTGVTLYNATSWMNPEPGTPNSVGPWKKQLGHAAPVIVYREGKPVLTLGATGGRRIVTALFQAIVNHVDFGMDVQEAIAAPRLHVEGASASRPIGSIDPAVLIDDRIPAEAVADLERRGHQVQLAHETIARSGLGKPLGIQATGDELIGGVDIFRRSMGIGV